MQPDPTLVADTRAWLVKARQDLRRARILLGSAPPDVEGALFHSQQAAEKSLKGFLTWRDIRFRRTHDLDALGKQCVAADSSLAGLAERAEPLTGYAWRFRYPGAPSEPRLEEGEEALAMARELLNAILDKLPPEVHP